MRVRRPAGRYPHQRPRMGYTVGDVNPADQDQIDVPEKSACDTIEQFASKLRVFKQCLVVVPDGSQPNAIVFERIHSSKSTRLIAL
jgi:hypothetical protein